MNDNAFQLLKDTCNNACHERQACKEGYKQMLASENVSQMMATWRANWEDVMGGKFGDIIRTELPKQYPDIKAEMNAAGVYLNECSEGAKKFVRVIVTDTEEPVRIYGDAQAYILGDAKVIAFGHSQVYNTDHAGAHVMLYDYAYGRVMAGTASAYNRSTLQCCGTAHVDGSVQCDAFGGTVHAVCYRQIRAYRDTIVYSNGTKGIILADTAQLKPLNDYEQ